MNADEMVKAINDRFAELKTMEQDAVKIIQGKQADLNAILGAQQDCQYWLARVADSVKAGTEPPAFVPNAEIQPAPKAANPLETAAATEDSNKTIN